MPLPALPKRLMLRRPARISPRRFPLAPALAVLWDGWVPVFERERRWFPLAPLLAVLLASCTAPADVPEEVTFNRHIRPILSDKCFVCHGFDPGTREANLRLDLREAATAVREGYDRPAIVPGNPGSSALVERIHSSNPDEIMPPPDTRAPLTEREKALLERWIEQGAEWEPHWLYVAPQRPIPPIEEDDAVRNPIDAFVVARLREGGLAPSPEAVPVTLVRRLSFDLTGLPPDSDEIKAFTGDPTEAHYERLVEDLLASPHYGEQMAVMWLDLVRYADTDGYHSDLHRNVSPFRDYVIQAFNANKPFDQFTREQIAGDLLPHTTTEQHVAAGYNRLGQATKEGGAQPKEYLVKYAGDRVRTVSTVWMGSTVGCAECHDHKFDPFTQKEFYSMAAFFADVQEEGVFPNLNVLLPERPLPDRRESIELSQLEQAIEVGRRRGESVEALLEQRTELLGTVPHVLATESVEPRMVRVLRRGNWRDNRGVVAEPGVPAILPPLGVEGRRADRLDLADWLVSRENPATARVFVNHLWARFFGYGIARVLDDLGSQGDWPTHPDLLDWLAVEFMESGWDVKHVVKLIVTSATYRQSSRSTEELDRIDPENRLLARQERLRFGAEMVRDNALAVSGMLDRRLGGDSVKPYQPDGYWSDIRTFGIEGPASTWEPSEGDDQYRRGLYTYWKRSFLHPSMMAFDATDRQECTAERARSNTPLQALVLLNDPSYVEAARVFAERILREGGEAVEGRLRWGFRQALSRDPDEAEVSELESLLHEELAWFGDRPEEAHRLVGMGQAPVLGAFTGGSSAGGVSVGEAPIGRVPADGMPAGDASVRHVLMGEGDLVQLAAWTGVARALFNTHEFITKY